MSRGHEPLRKCVVCGEKKKKAELFRIALCDGVIKADETQKSGGRGAYICKEKNCIDNLVKKRALSRAFKRQTELFVYDEILEKINRS